MRLTAIFAVFVFCLIITQLHDASAVGAKIVVVEAKAKPEKNAKPEKADKEEVASYNSITLRGLNKVTARSSLIEGPLGTVMRFGNLEMIASRCWQSPPEEQPENAALLEIWELKPKESPARIFAGWMFSSSPGLSSLQHPVYDITVVSCNRPAEKIETAPAKEEPKTGEHKPVEPLDVAPARKPEDEPDPAENPLD